MNSNEQSGDFSHIDANGNAVMVDVTYKEITERTATACGKIYVNRQIIEAIKDGTNKKGNVLATARIAGIMGAKKTAELIPMCHPLMLTKVDIDFQITDSEKPHIDCTCTAKLKGQTGVEMEALTGVNVALLTVYDMCKAVDKGMIISDIHLVEKTGGKSGYYKNDWTS